MYFYVCMDYFVGGSLVQYNGQKLGEDNCSLAGVEYSIIVCVV